MSVERPEIVVGRGRDGRISLLSLVQACSAGQTGGPRLRRCSAEAARPLWSPRRISDWMAAGVDFSADAWPGFPQRRSRISTSPAAAVQLAGGEPAALDFGFATAAGETLEPGQRRACTPQGGGQPDELPASI